MIDMTVFYLILFPGPVAPHVNPAFFPEGPPVSVIFLDMLH